MPAPDQPNPDPLPPVTNPGPADRPEGDDKSNIISIDTIKAALTSRAAEAAATLARLRKERETLNKRIKVAVTEEQEARRLAAALKPRAARKAKAAK